MCVCKLVRDAVHRIHESCVSSQSCRVPSSHWGAGFGETEWQTREILLPAVRSLNGYSSQSWTRQEPGASSRFLSHVVIGTQIQGPSSTIFLGETSSTCLIYCYLKSSLNLSVNWIKQQTNFIFSSYYLHFWPFFGWFNTSKKCIEQS